MIVIKQFRDKISKVLHHEGEIYMGSEDRMGELVALGYLEPVQEEPNKEIGKGRKKKGD